MNKQELIHILMALSKLEGYVLGKTGACLPDDLGKEVSIVAELLAKHIKEQP